MANKQILIGNPGGEEVRAVVFDPDGDGYFKMATDSGASALVTVTPVLTVAATYATGDYVGTSGTAMVFSDAARVAGGAGIVIGATLVQTNGTAAATGVAGELWLFDGIVTPPADSAAWTISNANIAKCIGIIPFSTYYASALGAVSVVNSIQMPFKCGAASTSLYGCFVTRGSPTYVSQELTFRLRILQD